MLTTSILGEVGEGEVCNAGISPLQQTGVKRKVYTKVGIRDGLVHFSFRPRVLARNILFFFRDIGVVKFGFMGLGVEATDTC